MEILDLYDDFGNKLNKTINRGEKPLDGENIMLSIVYIKNNEDKYLIQKASKEKGGYYSSTGGHVTEGEDGLSTILREMQEELSLDNIHEENLIHVKTFKYPNKYCIFNVYLYEVENIDLNTLKLQEIEVSKVMWLTKEEVLDLIDQGLFLESHGYIFKNYILK